MISELLQSLKESVASVGLELERVRSPRLESNMTNAEKRENNSVVESMTMGDLLVLEGSLDECRVRILKDDGCSTNVFSHEFFQTH